MNEPRWRTVLCWSAVVTFFTAPLVVFVLHIVAVEKQWNIGQRWEEFSGIGAFYQIISTLVFGLAGLQSFDRFVQQKNGKKYEQEPPKPIQSKRSN
jgi:hypothetical protein